MVKKLLIIDLESNYSLKKNNYDVIHLSVGSVILEKCKIIKFSQIKNENHKSFKKKILLNFRKVFI